MLRNPSTPWVGVVRVRPVTTEASDNVPPIGSGLRGSSANPVVTGRRRGIPASGGKRSGKKKAGAGVVTRC